MSSYEYDPVAIPSSPSGNNNDNNNINKEDKDNARKLSSLLLVSPFFYFILDPMSRMLPSKLVTATITTAMAWRRFLGNRPLKQCSRSVLHDITVAHLLLCLPLVWWFVHATDVALLKPTSHHALKHTGQMASYTMMAAFVTSSKSHSFVSLMTGLSFERLIPVHMASALLTVWMALLHSIQIAYYNKGEKSEHHEDHDGDHDDQDDHDDHDDHDHDDHDDHDGHRILHHHASIHAYLGSEPNLWKFLVDGEMNRTGLAVLTSLLLMVLTSVFHKPMRKFWFEGWLVSHIAGAITILVAGILHGADIFPFAVGWWALDWVIRYGFMVAVRYPKQARVTRIAENLTKVEWPKTDDFHYEPGQFVQIAVPAIKLWEFHPISIASAPSDPMVTLFVRALPNRNAWTRQLWNAAAPLDDNRISTNSVRVFLEGPYGSLPPILENRNQHKYSVAVFVSGGIGVTPCHSIAKSLMAEETTTNRFRASSLRKILYIQSIRNEDMIAAIPPPTMVDNNGTGSSSSSSSSSEDDIELVERKALGDADSDEDDENEDADDDDVSHNNRRSPLAVQTDIYVTQMHKFLDSYDDDEVHKEVTKANSQNDDSTATILAPNTTMHRGRRPDVHAILKKVSEEAAKNGWGRVFVMGCGPVALLEDLEVACQQSETKAVQIDFHPEVFDY